MAADYNIGDRITFNDSDHGVKVVLAGTVNGASIVDSTAIYVPVHVHGGNKNIYVNEKNITLVQRKVEP